MTSVPLGDLLVLADSGVWGAEDPSQGISILRSTNFNSDGTLDLSKLSLRALRERDSARKLLQPGDILLEKSGGGPKQPVGRVCLFRGDAQPHAFGNFIARLRPCSEVLSEYLFYYLWHFHRTGRTSQYQKQTTGIRNLEFKRFLTVPVPMRSLGEQRRIVDLLSRAEGIVRLCREAQAKAQAIIPALFLDMFGDPARNPKRWPVFSLGALLAEPPQLGTMAKPSATRGHWLDLRVANIQGGQLTLHDQRWLDLAAPEIDRFGLRDGDILLARAIGSLDHLGKAVIVHPTSKWTFDSHLMRLRVNREVLLPEYLKAFLESPGGRAEFLKDTRQSAVQFNINGKEIRRISMPCPPLAAQLLFVERYHSISCLLTREREALKRAEVVLQALLDQTFDRKGLRGA